MCLPGSPGAPPFARVLPFNVHSRAYPGLDDDLQTVRPKNPSRFLSGSFQAFESHEKLVWEATPHNDVSLLGLPLGAQTFISQ